MTFVDVLPYLLAVVWEGVNKFVLTTIFEKSKTGGRLGSVGPGPIVGGLLIFPFEIDDPVDPDCWDDDTAGGTFFEIEGEGTEAVLEGVLVDDEDGISVFLISLFFVFYGLTVNCLFGTITCMLFFPVSVDVGLAFSLLWVSFEL
jgi:hypothetical protein